MLSRFGFSRIAFNADGEGGAGGGGDGGGTPAAPAADAAAPENVLFPNESGDPDPNAGKAEGEGGAADWKEYVNDPAKSEAENAAAKAEHDKGKPAEKTEADTVPADGVYTRAYQPSFTGGVLSPALHARVDLAKYGTGLKVGKNLFIHPHGGVSNRAGTEFIARVKTSANRTRLIPFQFSDDQSYALEFGNEYMRVYRDGGVVLAGGDPYEISTPFTTADLDEIVFAQEADIMYLVHRRRPPQKLSRFADNNWTMAAVTFEPSITAPGGLSITAPGDTSGEPGYVATDYRYKVSSISEETGEESLPSASFVEITNDLSIAGGRNRIAWNARAGAERYIVYKLDGGTYGYIGSTEGLFFVDSNFTPDLADGPQRQRNIFNGFGNYPRCVNFIEQRLAFASTDNDPQAVWLSQSGNYENFNYSRPAKASDAVRFRVKARQVQQIRSMVATRGLMLLTSSAEWVVSGGSQSDAITPSAIKIDNQGYRGASMVQPVVVGNIVLFPQARGGVIRDFSYEFAQDSYVGKDLTILARHFFENKTIKAWAYAQAPNSIVWVVMSDGSLVSLTYMKEHDVWGWTEHDTRANGVFEDVIVISEGGEDVPYFIVKRHINGLDRRYVERLHTRVMSNVRDAFFVDSGLSYNGPAVDDISGLSHLEGQTVAVLADGNVVRGLVVTGGSITLPNEASRIHVGLPMVASLQTLDLDLGQVPGLGSVQGRQKSVSEVTLRVENTRGIWVGPDLDKLVEYKQRSTEAWNEAIKLYTGDISITPEWDWNTHGSMWVRQNDPLPMTILAIMPDVTLGR